jgi:8-oxo-dGTP pyrophosphatase MutT (NUDIX family)
MEIGSETTKREYALYHVALKILLKRDNTFLFLRPRGSEEQFDLPGGRIDNVEHEMLLEEVLAREVREELGDNLKYKLGKPLFQFRRHFEDKNWHIFITVYEADFLSGDIELSDEHSSYEWISQNEFTYTENNFFSREEYLAFKKYFEKGYSLL